MATTYEGTTEQARRIVHHHAVLRRGLERRVGTICAAVEHGVPHERPLATLRSTWRQRSCLTPRRRNAFSTRSWPARPRERTRPRPDRRARELAYLAGQLQPDTDGSRAATVAEWIATLFAGHVAKQNELLHVLAGSAADVAALVADAPGRAPDWQPGTRSPDRSED